MFSYTLSFPDFLEICLKYVLVFKICIRYCYVLACGLTLDSQLSMGFRVDQANPLL